MLFGSAVDGGFHSGRDFGALGDQLIEKLHGFSLLEKVFRFSVTAGASRGEQVGLIADATPSFG